MHKSKSSTDGGSQLQECLPAYSFVPVQMQVKLMHPSPILGKQSLLHVSLNVFRAVVVIVTAPVVVGPVPGIVEADELGYDIPNA